MKEGVKIIREAIKANNAVKFNNSIISKFKPREMKWREYDSSMNNFACTFFECLPKEYTEDLISKYNNKDVKDIREKSTVFKKYIEETLSKTKNHDLVALELGGTGSKVFSEFKKGFFKKTLGVCLNDIRSPMYESMDLKRGHSVITGDILKTGNDDVYSKIIEKLHGRKVDLVISRMMGPLCYYRNSPIIMENIIRKVFSILNENGIVFFQIYYIKDHEFNKKTHYEIDKFINTYLYNKNMKNVKIWAERIKKHFPMIEVQVSKGVIRIHKGIGAPNELPKVASLF